MIRKTLKKRPDMPTMINFQDFVHIRNQKEKVINVNMIELRILSNKIGKKPSLWISSSHSINHMLEVSLPLLIIAQKTST
jgi:hypothetical protein